MDAHKKYNKKKNKVAFFSPIRSKVPLTLKEKKTGSQKLFPDLSLYI